ncbi:protein FAM83G-like isoform X2 [Anguilla anguilla]|uniref:protein FAM83G-like isoform X2 n=1 Tax=Anguilla anguilla TaxID=7936 RepID=UPI0015B29300|nr:protein FAM83G-like isoform X2 [Anguilla anguilla]
MALSQVECLDDNHENLPLEDSKPEFLYSEDQRLALEALIHGGRKAFQEYIQDHSVRQFLSEPEQNQLTGAAVAHQPESEEEGAKNGEDVAGSLQYWPDRSDCSIPEFDIGWPDRVSYRGVTRVSVYTQPPMDGKTHIKEIVRKTITLAQKVIAVVMDLFTDVDIFQDLLDASFRRRVAVYIILEATGIPYFLSMCKKAAMHQGHLKNLRVRTAGGTVLHTHSHRKVCGQLSQKFMFVDGDRAVTGSYSYTWMASRLDRNLVTVLTGEAVETFDRQFRELYLLSEGVSLSEIGLEAEPELQLASQLAVPSTPSPTTARKDMNPKYALLSTSTKGSTNSSGVQNVSERSGTRTTGFPRPAVKILRQLREVAEPPIHPALQDLERANMMYYLTTWPEPDPSIDVIEDCSEPPQAHLTQAELDETSQPICFKDALVHSTDSQEVPKEAKEVSRISMMSEEHCKNLKTANGPNATDAQGVQNEAKEVSSISVTSEEHNKNLRTTNGPSATDAQEVQKLAKEISSISATSEEHNENLRTANGLSTTDAQGVQKEAKEVPSISVTSEVHNKNLRTTTDYENLKTAKGLNATDAQGVQNEAKEVSSISTTSEEHNENLRTANNARSTDAQVVQNEAKEISSISAMSEEHNENLRTANSPSSTDTQEAQNKAKEISSISATSEEHNENLRTANSARSTDTQEVQNAAKDISSISVTLEEHNENLRTANGPSTIDAQEIQKEAKEVSSISITTTANGPGATNTQGVQKEAKEVSSISAKSKEHYENTEPAKYGSACNGSVQLERSQVDELNAARASQPMVEQQMQEQPHPQHASRVLSKCSEEKQETRQTHRQVQTDRWKPIQTSSRPPASKVHYQQEVPVWGSTNTAGTRLDGHIQSPNLAGGITGGHPFWNANQLALSRPGWGSNPPSRDQPSSVRGFASNWPAQTQLGSQAYHAPNRQLQGWPQGQLGWARPTHQGPAPAHWPPGPQGDARGHPSPLFNRHTLHRAVNGNEPEAQLWMR